MAFVDRRQHTHGVESICKVLLTTTSAYWRHAWLLRQPDKRCARAKRDEVLLSHVQRVWPTNMLAHGADKVWMQMNRKGI